MSVKKQGIDISAWQGDIDAAQVKNSGIEFVIIREGYRQTADSKFFQNAERCKEAGIDIMGVYHFSYALNVEQVKQEAQSCIANVKKAGLDKNTVVFFDFEYDTVTNAADRGVKLGRTECNAFTKTFCETVESLGYRAGIYFNIDYYRNWFDHDLLDKYVRWLADWNGAADYACVFHQYSCKGVVLGIKGNVDMNYYYGEEKIAAGTTAKTVDEIAQEVIAGKWGNAESRKTALTKAGYNYSEVQKRVNALLSPDKKSVDTLAREVLDGKWGNGDERKERLTKAGYDYAKVQSRVNELV